MPATLKTREKARKYHFLPRKSMLVLRNNSTLNLKNRFHHRDTETQSFFNCLSTSRADKSEKEQSWHLKLFFLCVSVSLWLILVFICSTPRHADGGSARPQRSRARQILP